MLNFEIGAYVAFGRNEPGKPAGDAAESFRPAPWRAPSDRGRGGEGVSGPSAPVNIPAQSAVYAHAGATQTSGAASAPAYAQDVYTPYGTPRSPSNFGSPPAHSPQQIVSSYPVRPPTTSAQLRAADEHRAQQYYLATGHYIEAADGATQCTVIAQPESFGSRWYQLFFGSETPPNKNEQSAQARKP